MTDPQYLTCEEMFRRLDRYLDRQLSPDDVQRVEAHLAICEICAKEYSFEAHLLDGIRQKLNQPKVPKELAERISAALDVTLSCDDDQAS